MDFYLSTIGENAAELAREYGLGLEIAEFAYAVNMDEDFPRWDSIVRAKLKGIEKRTFHAPFGELCPASADPLIAEATRRRLQQSYETARRYGINKMVVHSGYVPRIYVKSWFAKRSAAFWRDFLASKPPEFTVVLENVMEESPELLLDIAEQTGDPRMLLCLDIGHAGGYFSKTSVLKWIELTAPRLGHAHFHNNYGSEDSHNPPGDGLIDMKAALTRLAELRPDLSAAAETQYPRPAVEWLARNGFIET
jgi:sugar phosphate isomerase/epimerase